MQNNLKRDVDDGRKKITVNSKANLNKMKSSAGDVKYYELMNHI